MALLLRPHEHGSQVPDHRSQVNMTPACSRSLVMLTPPVEAEQGPLALVSEEMSVWKSTHCNWRGGTTRDVL